MSNIVKTVNYCHQLCNLIFKAQDKNCQSLMAPEFLPLTNSADPFQDNIFSGSSLSQHQLKFFNYILHNNKKVIISQIRTKALHGANKSNSQLLPFATHEKSIKVLTCPRQQDHQPHHLLGLASPNYWDYYSLINPTLNF